MYQVKKYLKPTALFLSVFFFWFFLFYFQLEENLAVSIYSHKQILKAFGWLNGVPEWLGPELLVSGGTLTGPFFYFLLLPPLFFNSPYTAAIIWLISWLSLTYTIAFLFIRDITKNIFSAPLFLVLIAGSPVLLGGILDYYDWNSLFSIFFHLILLICLYKWKLKKQDSLLYLIGLFLGLGIQVHYSVFFHIITLILFLVTDWRPWKSESKMALSGCLTFFLLPQLPWLGAVISDRIYAPDFNLYHIINYLYQFLERPEKWISGLLESLDLFHYRKGWHFGGILTLLIFFIALKKKKQKAGGSIYREDSPFILSLILIMPVLFLFPSIYSYPDLFFIPLFTIMVFVKWMDDIWPEKKFEKYSLFILYSLALFFPALASDLFKNVYFKNIHELSVLFLVCAVVSGSYFGLLSLNTLKKSKVRFIVLFFGLMLSSYKALSLPESKKGFTYSLKEIISFLIDQGEDSNEVFDKIFQVGMRYDDFLFPYLLAKESFPSRFNFRFDKNQKMKQKQGKTGYFIVYNKRKRENFHQYSTGDWLRYLSSDIFPEEIQKEISEKRLKIKSIDFKNNRWIISYFLSSDSIFQEGFRNVEKTFGRYKETHWVDENCYFPSFLKRDNRFYLCSISQGYLERTAFLIEFPLIKSESSFIKVSFAGHPLMITSPDSSNSHLIKDITFDMECPHKVSIKVLSHIGLSRKKSEYYKSFFAPLTLKIPVNCDLKNLKKFSVHFNRQREYNPVEKLSYFWPVSEAVKALSETIPMKK